MDFTDSTDEATFRAEANAFLSQHLQPKKGAATRSGNYLQRAKDWQKVKAENQFAQITWPKEIGGRGGSSMQQVIWNQEESKFDAPTGPFAIGLGMCVPTVIARKLANPSTPRTACPGLGLRIHDLNALVENLQTAMQ